MLAGGEFDMPMFQSKTRFLAAVALVAFTSIALAACGSTTIPTPTPTPVGASASASPIGSPGAGLTGQAAHGRQLFGQYTCGECHSITGERIVGPPLNGLYGSKVTLTSGKTVVADDDYIKLSIMEPDSQIVNGYPSGVMSSHIEQYLSSIEQPNNLDALLAYIKSLK
jgi:mono/diheme cytochrome c family protein